MPSKIKKSSWGGTRAGAGRPRKLDAKAAAFEAAQPSLNRGLVWVPTTDPKRELTAYTRMEILRLSRWLYNNAPQATYRHCRAAKDCKRRMEQKGRPVF